MAGGALVATINGFVVPGVLAWQGECVARIDATNLINPYFDFDEPMHVS